MPYFGTMDEDRCPFCNLEPERVVSRSDYTVTIRDAYPVSPGHSLILPARHFSSWFQAHAIEKAALIQALDEAKEALDRELSPDGYNIGINDGEAAGQTIGHLHVHLIPRYRGDTSDARGGVRWIFPESARYWKK